MSSSAIRWRALLDPRQDRFWWTLLGLGIALRFVASIQSGLGVDAHLHAAYTLGWMGEGDFDPGWGPVRNPANPSASDPDASGGIGARYLVWHAWLALWFILLGSGTTAIHTASAVVSVALLIVTHRLTSRLYDSHAALRLTALVAVHPLLILTAAMGYQEELVALLLLLSCAATLAGLRQLQAQGMPWWWLTGAPLLVAFMLTKGVSWLLVMSAGGAFVGWVMLELIIRSRADLLRRRPVSSVVVLTVLVWASLAAVGLMGDNGSLSRAIRDPARLAIALPLSALVLAVVWFSIGLLVWPFLPYMSRRLRAGGISTVSLHLLVLVTVPLAIVIWTNAALWAYESTLVGTPVWLMPIRSIQNVRYLSVLLVPVHWLLLQLAHDETGKGSHPPMDVTAPLRIAWRTALRAPGSLARLDGRSVAMAATVLILLPLAATVAFVGEDDTPETAAEQLAAELEPEEEFLLVTGPKSGTHRLYQLRLGLDPEGERNITGHWRSTESDWQTELEVCISPVSAGNISHVNHVILTPQAVDIPPIGWTEKTVADLPEGWRLLEPLKGAQVCR